MVAIGDSLRSSLPPQQRALYLFVLMRVGWSGASRHRSVALEVYRPYLHSAEPELQRAAVMAASLLYDYAVRDEIEHISWNSSDWKARSMARIFERDFLDFGPDPESRPKMAHGVRIGGYDPEGLRAYHASTAEWKAAFHGMQTGEAASSGSPNPQPTERDPAQSPPSTSRAGRRWARLECPGIEEP